MCIRDRLFALGRELVVGGSQDGDRVEDNIVYGWRRARDFSNSNSIFACGSKASVSNAGSNPDPFALERSGLLLIGPEFGPCKGWGLRF